MDHTQLRDYLYARGPMNRKNPALVQLHQRTGYSVEHLYLLALGHRKATRRCQIALDNELKNKSASLKRKEGSIRPGPDPST